MTRIPVYNVNMMSLTKNINFIFIDKHENTLEQTVSVT